MRALGLAIGLLGALLAGCEWNQPTLEAPMAGLSSPYPVGPDVVWAVAPLANESGTSIVDELVLTDRLVEQIRQVNGLTALPVNRTLAGMRALGLPAIQTPDEAQQLAAALGADGIIVGSVTSWHPYNPPRLGLNLVLFARSGVMQRFDGSEQELLMLRTAATDAGLDMRRARDIPVAAAADQIDASNHATLLDIRDYAQGRYDDRTALGWELYTQSMGRFTEYACFRMVRLLLEQEYERLAVAEARRAE
jgi:hypothetical protein